MENTKKGAVAPLILVIIAVAAIGGGTYYFKNKPSIVSEQKTEEAALGNNIVEDQSILSPKENVNSEIYTESQSTRGIVITSFKANDLVALPITVKGYLDGNGWAANEGEIGFVEVFDGNGKAIVGREVIRTTSNWLQFPTYFEVVVGDREQMSYLETDMGIVKITGNGAKDGDKLKTITIPIRFK